MKTVKRRLLDDCPYCHQAFSMMEKLCREHEEYRAVDIEVIEESKEPEKIKGYNYWYVPTYFVDNVKIHEGVPTLEKVEEVYRQALK